MHHRALNRYMQLVWGTARAVARIRSVAAEPPAPAMFLGGLELRKRAATAGVPADLIEEAQDSDQPKQDIITLILVQPERAGPTSTELLAQALPRGKRSMDLW